MTDKHKKELKAQEIARAFKFEPGPHAYIVEIKVESQLTKDDISFLQKKFDAVGIHIIFIFTEGDGFTLNAVPAKEKQ